MNKMNKIEIKLKKKKNWKHIEKIQVYKSERSKIYKKYWCQWKMEESMVQVMILSRGHPKTAELKFYSMIFSGI